MNKIDEIEKLKQEFEEKLNALKSEYESKLDDIELKDSNVFAPKKGELYFVVSSYGEVNSDTNILSDIDKKRLLIGNVFKTKEEAEFVVERLKVIAELKKFAKPRFLPDELNYIIFYSCESKRICVNSHHDNIITTLCFESEETARRAIEKVGKDRIKKYYFGVEE